MVKGSDVQQRSTARHATTPSASRSIGIGWAEVNGVTSILAQPQALSDDTDHTLRVLMHCAKNRDRRVTIGGLAAPHGLSRHHLVEVVHDTLASCFKAQHGATPADMTQGPPGFRGAKGRAPVPPSTPPRVSFVATHGPRRPARSGRTARCLVHTRKP